MTYTIKTIYHKSFSKTPVWAKGITVYFGQIGQKMTKDEAKNVLESMRFFLQNEYKYRRRNSVYSISSHPIKVEQEQITVCSIEGNDIVTFKIAEL